MNDWTNPAQRQFWFDNKYCALMENCSAPCVQGICSSPSTDVTGWWNDLAEPEMFNCGQTYHGWTEDDSKVYNDEGTVHNLYGFYWAKAIYEGYVRNKVS